MSRLPSSLAPALHLAPGARIALVAPSGPFDREGLERAAERLRARYDVRYAPGIFERKGYLAGPDARRREELLAAVADPDVTGIVAARGGYGLTRIVGAVDPAVVARRRPLLAGFSDITALHAAWARAGVRSLHGSMAARMGSDPDDRLWARWIAALEGAAPAPIPGLRALAPGRATGALVGGNLAVLAALAGTPHAPPLDGALLFLEDTGEKPYRIDRMLTQLRDAGWLARVAGVVLGAFSECPPNADGVTVDDVLADLLGGLGVPVASGVPAGHLEDNLELPLGSPATLDADAGTLVVHEGVSGPAS